jgi:hypothetical protein
MSNPEDLDKVVFGQLEDGPLYRFSDYASLGAGTRSSATGR